MTNEKEGDRALERRIKNLKASGRLCPICGTRHPGGRLHVPQPDWQQLSLFDPFDTGEPIRDRPDWLEWNYFAPRATRYGLGDLADAGAIPY